MPFRPDVKWRFGETRLAERWSEGKRSAIGVIGHWPQVAEFLSGVYSERDHMRRLFVFIVPLSLTILAFAQQPPAAHSLPSKKDAVDLLKKVEVQTRLTAPGRAPFRLLANLRWTSSANSSDGAYEVLWEAPGRFREGFRLDPIRVRMLTGLPDMVEVVPTQIQVGKIYRSAVAGENLVCFEFAEPSKGRTECLDSVTDLLVSVDHKTKHGNTTIGLVEDRFISLGAVNYPRHMLSTVGDESLEVNIEKLEPVTRFADEVFAPPDGAFSPDWCAKPEVGKQPGQSSVSPMIVGLLSQQSKEFRGYYLQVASNGRVKKMAAIYSDGTSKEVGRRDLGPEWFRIHSCGGKPIEYETLFVFWAH